MSNHLAAYEVVPYCPEFKEQVLQLQTQLWSPSLALNRAYFDWKHEQNPYLKSRLFLGLHAGTVVGMRSFFGIRWEAGVPTQQLNALYADDFVIDSAHRNSGLSRTLMKAALDALALQGHAFVFNLSAGGITVASSLAMGWRDVGVMRPMLWRPWRVYAEIGAIRLAERVPLLSGLASIANRAAPRFPALHDTDPHTVSGPSSSGSPVTFTLEPRPHAMAQLVERLGYDGRIRHVRDEAFFAWRFRNPLNSYGFLFAGKGNDLDGYLVLKENRIRPPAPDTLSIVDFEVTSDSIFEQLLAAARQVAAGRKQLAVWTATWSPDRVARLARNGFSMPPEKHGTANLHANHLLVRSLPKQRPLSEWRLADRQLTSLNDWDLRMLYSMHS